MMEANVARRVIGFVWSGVGEASLAEIRQLAFELARIVLLCMKMFERPCQLRLEGGNLVCRAGRQVHGEVEVVPESCRGDLSAPVMEALVLTLNGKGEMMQARFCGLILAATLEKLRGLELEVAVGAVGERRVPTTVNLELVFVVAGGVFFAVERDWQGWSLRLYGKYEWIESFPLPNDKWAKAVIEFFRSQTEVAYCEVGLREWARRFIRAQQARERRLAAKTPVRVVDLGTEADRFASAGLRLTEDGLARTTLQHSGMLHDDVFPNTKGVKEARRKSAHGKTGGTSAGPH